MAVATRSSHPTVCTEVSLYLSSHCALLCVSQLCFVSRPSLDLPIKFLVTPRSLSRLARTPPVRIAAISLRLVTAAGSSYRTNPSHLPRSLSRLTLRTPVRVPAPASSRDRHRIVLSNPSLRGRSLDSPALLFLCASQLSRRLVTGRCWIIVPSNQSFAPRSLSILTRTAHSCACPSSRFVSWMAVAGSSHQIPLLTDVALYLDSSPALLLCVSQLPLRFVAFL